MKTEGSEIPNDGFLGMKENWKSDLLSGFLVFLIALPLCLGISSACHFPAISGIMTAIVGGVIVTFFQGAYVTIKGPAAGLIVIVLGSVEALGQGNDELGYRLTLAVIVVAGIVQILFGVFRTGVFGDFFPSSAVHGMLAAIGIIIAAKQIHFALGVKSAAKTTFDLIADIPHSVMNLNPDIAIIGGVSLLILFLLPMVKNKYVKMIPGPMLVILVAIPLGYYFDLEHIHRYVVKGSEYEVGPFNLVTIGNLMEAFKSPDWSQITSWTSLEYIILFALVGSLESLISTKAIDILDPYKRKSNLNKDLLAVGIGNTICGFIGGLPMISEIVRSSANINNGGKTKWTNFYHGLFLLIFVSFAAGMIHHIPLAALAAMLIYTGYRLASPKVFRETYRVGKEQLAIFVVTIIVTLAEGLLEGIFAGILVKFLLHIYSGAPLGSLFKSKIVLVKGKDNNSYTVNLTDAAIFSNYLGFKRVLDKIPSGKEITLDFSNVKIVDHTVMEHLHHYGEDYHRGGGQMIIKGMGKLRSWSTHPLSYRVLAKGSETTEVLGSREKEIKSFAKSIDFSYQVSNPSNQSNFGRFSPQPLRVKYEGNIVSGKINDIHYHLSDLSIVKGGEFKPIISHKSVLSISDLHFGIPIFSMQREVLMDKLMDKTFVKDIDFNEYPGFSNKYVLNGVNEEQVRDFFSKGVIEYFEKNDIYNIESLGAELLIYRSNKMANVAELKELLKFGRGLIEVISKSRR